MNLADFSQILTPEGLTALVTLSALEIVLGIDNVIFISILCGKLPVEQRNKARIIGLSLAMIMRIGLLFAITWVMSLKDTTALTIPIIDHALSGKDLILLLGGLFLVGKSTLEIHHKIETGGVVEAIPKSKPNGRGLGFTIVLAQILALDLVFSLDSVITAAGMTDRIPVMVVAVVLAVIVMLIFSGSIARFVDKHPTIKMLALSFLILIGVMLVAEAFHEKIPKGYIYFAMAFSLGVELLNLWVHSRARVKKALSTN